MVTMIMMVIILIMIMADALVYIGRFYQEHIIMYGKEKR